MTLRMGDGPVANLPAGLDAYAGYTDAGGIGITFPALTARFPNAHHLSISVHGQAPAMCGDVENGALSSWAGYDYGYCSLSRVADLVSRYGRPKKLWTAHYTGVAHICTPQACGFGLPFGADGTQWTDHGGVWDESLLADDFFILPAPAAPAAPAASSPAIPHPPATGGLLTVQVPQLQQGARGDPVAAVQKLVGGVAVDGNFGPITLAAVVRFQQAHHLATDGVVGVHTWGALLGQPQ